jgi:hypothetical protein
VPDSISFTAAVKFDHPVSVFVLQMGGWSPLALCQPEYLLLDRNIVGVLRRIHRAPDDPTTVSEKWWLEFLNSAQFHLNPVLAAIEGAKRRLPSLDEFIDELAVSTQAVTRVLTKANVVHWSIKDCETAYQMFLDRAERATRERRFLMAVAPLLVSRVGRSQFDAVEEAIFGLAFDHGLARNTFSVLAALSCLYEPDDGPALLIGRGVLKPTLKYSDADAHNAVADVHSLEFLAAANGMSGRSAGLCTRDRSLVGLWAGLNLTGGDSAVTPFTVTARPLRELFPRLTDMQALISRLKG